MSESAFHAAIRRSRQRHRDDFTTEEGVVKLKAKIEDVLKRNGLPLPTFKIVRVAGDCRQPTSQLMRFRYDLRSDMVNGIPKREQR